MLYPKIGYYSEGRDRRRRARIRRREQGSEFAALAKRCRERAANISGHGISSDDPNAIDKLWEKLAGLEAAAQGYIRFLKRVGRGAGGDVR